MIQKNSKLEGSKKIVQPGKMDTHKNSILRNSKKIKKDKEWETKADNNTQEGKVNKIHLIAELI